jgi:hypothetical protein
MSTPIMEAETISQTLDWNSIFTQMIAREAPFHSVAVKTSNVIFG